METRTDGTVHTSLFFRRANPKGGGTGGKVGGDKPRERFYIFRLAGFVFVSVSLVELYIFHIFFMELLCEK